MDFKGLIRQYVAPHRRQPVRLAWLYALVDLDGLWVSFSKWRDYYRYKTHITSQHRALQGHLTRMFGGGIILRSYSDQFLEIGLDVEPAHWVVFDPTQTIALEGEGGQAFADVDFIVYAPGSIDLNLLAAEVEKYKLADKVYKIVTRK